MDIIIEHILFLWNRIFIIDYTRVRPHCDYSILWRYFAGDLSGIFVGLNPSSFRPHKKKQISTLKILTPKTGKAESFPKMVIVGSTSPQTSPRKVCPNTDYCIQDAMRKRAPFCTPFAQPIYLQTHSSLALAHATPSRPLINTVPFILSPWPGPFHLRRTFRAAGVHTHSCQPFWRVFCDFQTWCKLSAKELRSPRMSPSKTSPTSRQSPTKAHRYTRGRENRSCKSTPARLQQSWCARACAQVMNWHVTRSFWLWVCAVPGWAQSRRLWFLSGGIRCPWQWTANCPVRIITTREYRCNIFTIQILPVFGGVTRPCLEGRFIFLWFVYWQFEASQTQWIIPGSAKELLMELNAQSSLSPWEHEVRWHLMEAMQNMDKNKAIATVSTLETLRSGPNRETSVKELTEKDESFLMDSDPPLKAILFGADSNSNPVWYVCVCVCICLVQCVFTDAHAPQSKRKLQHNATECRTLHHARRWVNDCAVLGQPNGLTMHIHLNPQAIHCRCIRNRMCLRACGQKVPRVWWILNVCRGIDT